VVAVLVGFTCDGLTKHFNHTTEEWEISYVQEHSFGKNNYVKKEKIMTKEEIALQKIEDAEKMLAEAKMELEASKELQEYHWVGKTGCSLNEEGEVRGTEWMCGSALFHFSTKEEAEAFSKKLKIMSVLNNLKKSLGDTAEFNGADFFNLVEYRADGCWHSEQWKFRDGGNIYFSMANISKVIDYMNKHYPKGWS
jgi:hypothetical protein